MKKHFTIIMAEFSDVRFDARVLKEASALAEMGFLVKLHMHDTSIDQDIKLVEGSIEYYIYSFKSRLENNSILGIVKKYLRAITILIKINTWIIFHKSEIYHAHNLKFLFSSYLASIIYKSKLVYDAHEIHSEHYDNKSIKGRIRNKFNEYLEKLILQKCDAFIQASEERADFISKKYKIPRPFVINNYVPFENIAKGNNKLRQELKLKEHPIMFYSGGIYLGGGRRLDNVIKAIANIDNIYFVIIGFMNESVKQQLYNMLDKYSLKSKVFILPPKPYELLFEYASSSDFGIIPLAGNSINTKLSALNKISEYLMAGLPILCSDYENLNNIIYHNPVGNVGITFNVYSCESIRDAIIKMKNEYYFSKMKENSLELAKTKLNWENEIGVLKEIYLSE
jgi:glycosyltransferase involved in cell wall biosynthesis